MIRAAGRAPVGRQRTTLRPRRRIGPLMQHRSRRRTPAFAVAWVVASLTIGLVTFLLLFPFSGADTNPPVCYSVFGYVVPCDAEGSVAVGVGTALVLTVVVMVTLAVRRRR